MVTPSSSQLKARVNKKTFPIRYLELPNGTQHTITDIFQTQLIEQWRIFQMFTVTLAMQMLTDHFSL